MTISLEDDGRRLVILRRRPAKTFVWLAVMVSSAVFFAAGAFAIHGGLGQRAMFVGAALLSVAVAARWLAMMLPKTPLLEADAEGLSMPAYFAATIPWRAISDVAPIKTEVRGAAAIFPEGRMWTVPLMMKAPFDPGWHFPRRLFARGPQREIHLRLHEMLWPRTPAGRALTGEDLRLLVRANKRAAARGTGAFVVPDDGNWRFFGLD